MSMKAKFIDIPKVYGQFIQDFAINWEVVALFRSDCPIESIEQLKWFSEKKKDIERCVQSLGFTLKGDTLYTNIKNGSLFDISPEHILEFIDKDCQIFFDEIHSFILSLHTNH
eukprot:TRINITY_DN25338_c0_g1_i1.p1 TRINITY_DN25338_c0_g1~~TRINITY_DN25338_c0_g1_i1.p1  ORF type:complete len:113 (+),score=33.85 TRINITY_DN25338_c0_g1_i1:150-488(+)